MFKKGDVLTLADNNEYAVVDYFEKNSKMFVYLVDINDNSNMLYGTLEGDEVVEITDPNILEDVIKQVNENLNNNA